MRFHAVCLSALLLLLLMSAVTKSPFVNAANISLLLMFTTIKLQISADIMHVHLPKSPGIDFVNHAEAALINGDEIPRSCSVKPPVTILGFYLHGIWARVQDSTGVFLAVWGLKVFVACDVQDEVIDSMFERSVKAAVVSVATVAVGVDG